MSQHNIPPYAPTAYTNSLTRPNNDVNLDEEVKLYSTTKQRELFESLAEIHSIIVTLDYLEKSFLRDSITHDEYTQACFRLIAQYNGILKTDGVAKEFDSLTAFKRRYNLDCELGIARLEVGIPATIEQEIRHSSENKKNQNGNMGGYLENENKSQESGNNNGTNNNNGSNTNNSDPQSVSKSIKGSAKVIAEITGNFITCMDAVKLNYKAKDQLHPLLSELMTSLSRMTTIGHEFSGRGKLVQWLIVLNKLKINEEISEEQSRQLLFDLDSAYKEFYTNLE